MSTRLGLQIGQSLMGMGLGLARGIRDQKEAEQEQADKQSEEKIYTLAEQILQNPEAAKSQEYTPKEKLKAMAVAADTTMDEYRQSEAGRNQEMEEMALSYQRVANLGRQYKALRDAGDDESAKEVLKKFVHHARNGVTGFKETGEGQVELELLDGSKRKMNYDLNQGDAFVNAYLKDESTHFKNRAAEKAFIQENNRKAMLSPETWVNEQGQTIEVQKGLIDPQHRIRYNLYYATDPKTGELAPLDSKSVAEGGFRPVKGWEAREKVAKSQYETDVYKAKRGVIGQADPTKAVKTNQGWVAPTNIGGVTQIPESQAPAQKPRIIGTVADEQGQMKALAQKDPYSTEVTAVDTGVKKDRKDKVYTVTDLASGEKVQMTAKEIRANLKEAKALLKNVKDDSGMNLIIPDVEDWDNMNNKKKETILGKVVRLASDTSQPSQVQDAAVKVLAYLEALGITKKGSPQQKKGFDLKQFHPDNYAPLQ